MRNFQFGEEHLFVPETEFSQILDLYNFDKDLRHITFNAIEQIEIAYRTAISNIMSEIYDSHWFENEEAFLDINEQNIVMEIIISEIKKKKKTNMQKPLLQSIMKNILHLHFRHSGFL